MIVLPSMLTRDLQKFDQDDFLETPKWVIMRNNSGLQVQLFWEAKQETISHSMHDFGESNELKVAKKRSKRKRSPHRISPIKTERFIN